MTSISPPSHLLKMKLITVWNGRMPDGGVVRAVTTTTAVKGAVCRIDNLAVELGIAVQIQNIGDVFFHQPLLL